MLTVRALTRQYLRELDGRVLRSTESSAPPRRRGHDGEAPRKAAGWRDATRSSRNLSRNAKRSKRSYAARTNALRCYRLLRSACGASRGCAPASL
jgi:hypothetical protein